MKKYYEILEVNPKASIEVIEKAYKVLVKKYHPDAYDEEEKIYAEQKLRDINEAYKILSDDFLREQYDSELERDKNNDVYYKKTNKEKVKTSFFEKKKNNEDVDNNFKKNNVGTYKGIIDVTSALFKNRPKISLKNLKREDYMAMGITAIIMIVLLVILWFIPFTNDFVKSLLPFLK